MDKFREIIFRADGNSAIGLGHVIRSTALATMLKPYYNCIIVTRCKDVEVLKEMDSAFQKIIQLPEIEYYTEAENLFNSISKESLIILDGYSFDDVYQRKLANAGFDFICIDDIHANKFFSKAIINSSGGISPLDYDALPSTQFFIGPLYSLLRPIFLEAVKNRRTVIDNKACFVCFGGADPDNQTIKIFQQYQIEKHFEQIHVVVGSAYKYLPELNDLVISKKNIILHQSLSAEEMMQTMRNCSYAICSPSTVVYEYMSCGGVVFLKQSADNQKHVIKFLLSEKLAFYVDDLNNVKPAQMNMALQKQAFYFDGRSGVRFIKLFKQYFAAKDLVIRKAVLEDLETCYNWANDEDVRAQSYNSNQVNFQDHIQWFKQKLINTNSFYYLLELNGNPVAQIRFQVNNNEAVLGFLADKTIRNKGLGTAILSKGIEIFVRDFQKSVMIIGYVKDSNVASQRSFERLAFKKERSTEYPNSFKYSMYYDN